jgi:hypothetical protein
MAGRARVQVLHPMKPPALSECNAQNDKLKFCTSVTGMLNPIGTLWACWHGLCAHAGIPKSVEI